ncbi:MAG: hypothetical protein NZM35_10985 [Chitinophagales bacterium]|nr:hypothetical protein [Chitinophagales bacterium]MDW8419838.1 hypothetical protein [Chitinophagales bacterium]
MVKKAAARILLVVISLICTLALCEVFLRINADERQRYYVWEPNLHHTFLPDSTVLYGISGQGRFTINAYGVRGGWNNDCSQRYVALGGSTTECLYLDDTETWQHHLSRLTGYCIAGMGKSGCGLFENYLHLKYAVPNLPRVDGIILMAGLNDMFRYLALADSFRYAAGWSPMYEDSMVRSIFITSDYYYQNKPLYRLQVVRLLVNVLKRNRPVPWESVQDVHGHQYNTWRSKRRNAAICDSLPDLRPGLKYFRDCLDSFYALCTQRKYRLVLVSQAYIYKDTMPDYENTMLWMGGKGDFLNRQASAYYTTRALKEAAIAYNNALKIFCMQHRDVVWVDLDGALPKDTSVFYDDCHFNEMGAERAAHVMAEKLRNL